MSLRLLAALCAVLVSAAQPAIASPEAPVAGEDYVVIEGGKPWQPLAGKIEVVEVFGYWCHVCDAFQPMVDRWKKTLPADVRFSYVPAAFSREDSYARGYYASEALGGLARTHNATFRAIHAEQTLPQRGATVEEVSALYGTLGLDAGRVAAIMTSKATDARMASAREFAVRSGVEGTPSVIVNGVYRVQARSLADVLRVADALVARERARPTVSPATVPAPAAAH